MNEKLVQLYIDGMEKGYLTHWGSWKTYSVPKEFTEALFSEEESIGSDDNPDWDRKDTVEWEKAGNLLIRKKLRRF